VASIAQYGYDAGNKRVWRGGAGPSGSLDELTFWAPNGQKLGTYEITYDSNYLNYYLKLKQTWVYFGGKLVSKGALYTGSGSGSDKVALSSVVQDRLGSQNGKFYPYGIERPSATTNDTEKFATYTRDAATGLDYAVNRYEQPGYGRFLSPDPYKASAGVADPGTWNRYAYVGGDPISFHDPSGLATLIPDGEIIEIPLPTVSSGSASYDCAFYGICMGEGYTPPDYGVGAGQQAAINIPASVLGWLRTLELLNEARNYIKDLWNPSEECSQLLNGIPGFTGIGSIRSAAQNVEFRGSVDWSVAIHEVSPVLGVDIYTAAPMWFSISGRYAEADLNSNRIIWRPGSINDWDSPGIAGALLHELLHNVGFSDETLASAFHVDILDRVTKIPNNTHVLSTTLADKCFH
jgi:RHS repeat-associated protein